MPPPPAPRRQPSPPAPPPLPCLPMTRAVDSGRRVSPPRPRPRESGAADADGGDQNVIGGVLSLLSDFYSDTEARQGEVARRIQAYDERQQQLTDMYGAVMRAGGEQERTRAELAAAHDHARVLRAALDDERAWRARVGDKSRELAVELVSAVRRNEDLEARLRSAEDAEQTLKSQLAAVKREMAALDAEAAALRSRETRPPQPALDAEAAALRSRETRPPQPALDADAAVPGDAADGLFHARAIVVDAGRHGEATASFSCAVAAVDEPAPRKPSPPPLPPPSPPTAFDALPMTRPVRPTATSPAFDAASTHALIEVAALGARAEVDEADSRARAASEVAAEWQARFLAAAHAALRAGAPHRDLMLGEMEGFERGEQHVQARRWAEEMERLRSAAADSNRKAEDAVAAEQLMMKRLTEMQADGVRRGADLCRAEAAAVGDSERAAALRGEAQALRHRVAALEAERSALACMRAEAEGGKEEAAELRLRVASLEADCRGLAAAAADAEAGRDEARARLAALEQARDQWWGDCSNSLRAMADRRRERQSMQDEIDSLKAQLQKGTAESPGRAGLRAEVTRERSERRRLEDMLQRAFEESQAAIVAVESRAQDAEARGDDLQRKLSDAEARLSFARAGSSVLSDAPHARIASVSDAAHATTSPRRQWFRGAGQEAFPFVPESPAKEATTHHDSDYSSSSAELEEVAAAMDGRQVLVSGAAPPQEGGRAERSGGWSQEVAEARVPAVSSPSVRSPIQRPSVPAAEVSPAPDPLFLGDEECDDEGSEPAFVTPEICRSASAGDGRAEAQPLADLLDSPAAAAPAPEVSLNVYIRRGRSDASPPAVAGVPGSPCEPVGTPQRLSPAAGRRQGTADERPESAGVAPPARPPPSRVGASGTPAGQQRGCGAASAPVRRFGSGGRREDGSGDLGAAHGHGHGGSSRAAASPALASPHETSVAAPCSSTSYAGAEFDEVPAAGWGLREGQGSSAGPPMPAPSRLGSSHTSVLEGQPERACAGPPVRPPAARVGSSQTGPCPPARPPQPRVGSSCAGPGFDGQQHTSHAGEAASQLRCAPGRDQPGAAASPALPAQPRPAEGVLEPRRDHQHSTTHVGGDDAVCASFGSQVSDSGPVPQPAPTPTPAPAALTPPTAVHPIAASPLHTAEEVVLDGPQGVPPGVMELLRAQQAQLKQLQMQVDESRRQESCAPEKRVDLPAKRVAHATVVRSPPPLPCVSPTEPVSPEDMPVVRATLLTSATAPREEVKKAGGLAQEPSLPSDVTAALRSFVSHNLKGGKGSLQEVPPDALRDFLKHQPALRKLVAQRIAGRKEDRRSPQRARSQPKTGATVATHQLQSIMRSERRRAAHSYSPSSCSDSSLCSSSFTGTTETSSGAQTPPRRRTQPDRRAGSARKVHARGGGRAWR
eukprot:TRINITY_DN7942_c1_g1_i1.p1 TRINITY_DN7942_c1_g1~~TRINITY_DN7942_c1_g1_i1.p1  ORF type:complete len:1415 (+),score=398.84 TRINITY_DN7942_c1_g1_i1:66-4310(+)